MPLSFEVVRKALTVWEAVLCNGREVVTADMVGVWAALLNDEGVTASEFDRASVVAVKAARFGLPKPVDVLEAVAAIRAGDRRALYVPLIMAIDRHGNEVAARVTDVDAGSDGLRALPAPAKALPAPPMTPEQRIESLRGMSPIARRAFVGILRMDGVDIAAEAAAIRRIEDEEAAAAKAERERLDAEQLARIHARRAAQAAAAPKPE